jgi:hypothetical protein
MSELVQIGSQPARANPACAPVECATSVLWLQVVTLLWMLIECGASLYAAAKAHSAALLAFGSDSFVELLSAMVVLLQTKSPRSISRRSAGRASLEFCFLFLRELSFAQRYCRSRFT